MKSMLQDGDEDLLNVEDFLLGDTTQEEKDFFAKKKGVLERLKSIRMSKRMSMSLGLRESMKAHSFSSYQGSNMSSFNSQSNQKVSQILAEGANANANGLSQEEMKALEQDFFKMNKNVRDR